jgi:hypothetical protein
VNSSITATIHSTVSIKSIRSHVALGAVPPLAATRSMRVRQNIRRRRTGGTEHKAPELGVRTNRRRCQRGLRSDTSAHTTLLLIRSRHGDNLAPGFRMQAYNHPTRLSSRLSGMTVLSIVSSLEPTPTAGTLPPATQPTTNRASRSGYAARATTLVTRPASAWAARLTRIRCSVCRFSSTYSSVFWFVIERPFRSLGRSIPRSTAWLLTRSQTVR